MTQTIPSAIDQQVLSRSYDFCKRIAKTEARNFYYALILLPRQRRRSICAVYAFMRFCDDIVDEEADDSEKRANLNLWRTALNEAYEGKVRDLDGPLAAFVDTVRRFKIPREYFEAIIDGMEMDLTIHRYATFDELYQYCYCVASAVGLVCIHIWGFEKIEALRPAEICGIAFQLTNILRDVQEDAEMGRVYLPQEDLEAFGYTEEDIRNGVYNESFRKLMAFQVDRARRFYDEAQPHIGLVDASCQACLVTMFSIYRKCLEEIVRRDYDVYSQRVSLSSSKKIYITARSFLFKKV